MRHPGPAPRNPITIGLLLLLLAGPGGLGGCAYFNTFSNAKKYYREAENLALDPQGNITSAARKKYDESIAKSQKLLDMYPDSKYVDNALFLMAKAYFMKQEYTRCLRRLGELHDRFPDNEYGEESLYLRGVCHLENGDESRAIAQLQRLEDKYPASKHLAEGIFRGGEADYRLANWRPAIASYRRLLDRFDKSDWNDLARLRIGSALHELKDGEAAVVALRDLAEKGDDRGVVFDGELLEAEILLELKYHDDAHDLLKRLETTAVNFQKRPETLLLLARSVEARGDLETTVLMLENAATEFPRSTHAAEAWYRVGLIRQVRLDDLEGAVEAYKQSSQEAARSLYGELARRKQTAIQEMLDVRAQFGDSPPDSSAADIQFKLAENQFLNLEDPAAALVEYDKILIRYPESPLAAPAAYAIAYLHRYNFGDTAAAITMVDRLTWYFPDSEAASFVTSWRAELGAGPAPEFAPEPFPVPETVKDATAPAVDGDDTGEDVTAPGGDGDETGEDVTAPGEGEDDTGEDVDVPAEGGDETPEDVTAPVGDEDEMPEDVTAPVGDEDEMPEDVTAPSGDEEATGGDTQ